METDGNWEWISVPLLLLFYVGGPMLVVKLEQTDLKITRL